MAHGPLVFSMGGTVPLRSSIPTLHDRSVTDLQLHERMTSEINQSRGDDFKYHLLFFLVSQYQYKTRTSSSFKRMYINPIDYGEVDENEQSLRQMGTNDDCIQQAISNKERTSVDLLAWVN